jgi:hypothetical protein
MPQIKTPLSERRRKAKKIMIDYDDLHKQTDALFIGMQENPGHVVTIVSPLGRAAVEKIFVGLKINWAFVRDPQFKGHFPDDWREFDFIIPGIVRDLEASNLPALRLPQHILDITPIDEMTPDQLACMMVFAVNDQNVRAMMYSEISQQATSSIPPIWQVK